MKFCLIGSSRFKELYDQANRELTLKGHVVYTIATVSTAAGGELPEEQKMVLDLVHLRKIQESEANVLITDDSGYYGFSTKREMVWGVMVGRPLFIFVPLAGKDSVIVHIGAAYGMRTLSDLPKPETVAEIIVMTRVQPDSINSPGGTA